MCRAERDFSRRFPCLWLPRPVGGTLLRARLSLRVENAQPLFPHLSPSLAPPWDSLTGRISPQGHLSTLCPRSSELKEERSTAQEFLSELLLTRFSVPLYPGFIFRCFSKSSCHESDSPLPENMVDNIILCLSHRSSFSGCLGINAGFLFCFFVSVRQKKKHESFSTAAL